MAQSTQQKQLWNRGRNGDLEFCASFKRLEIEDPLLYSQIEQREGFSMKDEEFEYKIGVSKYGMWLSRRRLQVQNERPPASQNDIFERPPPRPPAFGDVVAEQTQTQNQDAMVQAIQQQTDALKTLSASIEKLSANVSRILLKVT